MFALTILALLVAAGLLIWLNARAEAPGDEPAGDWRDDVPRRWRVPR